MVEYSETQLRTLALAPRVPACFSLLCAAWMLRKAYQNRCRLYHRFMLGLSVHVILFSLCNLAGTAAIPAGTQNVWGSAGTTATCSAQGFVLQVALCAPLYYVLMSLYSFLAVWHNFHVERYLWVEKWIHVAVHVFPIASAVYLLQQQAFNQPEESAGTACWINSVPFGCGDDNPDLPCERGPQNISQVAGVFAGLPSLFAMVVPAVVMAALYVQVRQHQDRIQLAARTVAVQASVYLGALYWTYGLTIIDASRGWKADQASTFAWRFIAVMTINACGVWFLLVYIYFWMPVTNKCHNPKHQTQRAQAEQPQSTGWPNEDSPASFNIFDGTNPSTNMAQFIFEGDSEDAKAEQMETEQWRDIQDHI